MIFFYRFCSYDFLISEIWSALNMMNSDSQQNTSNIGLLRLVPPPDGMDSVDAGEGLATWVSSLAEVDSLKFLP